MEEKKKFQIKDLIITALMVLCSQVLYRVLSFLFISPYTMLLAVPIWSIIGAIAYFLVPVKTKNPWMILLFCVHFYSFILTLYFTIYNKKILNQLFYCLCQVLVGKFPYPFLLSLFFYFFVSQTSPDYALNRYFFFSCQV